MGKMGFYFTKKILRGITPIFENSTVLGSGGTLSDTLGLVWELLVAL